MPGERENMRFTQIIFTINGRKKSIAVCESDYSYGDMTYEHGVINQIKALVNAGAVIEKIFQY